MQHNGIKIKYVFPLDRKKRLMKRTSTRKIYSGSNHPGRYIRSPMNDEYEDDLEENVESSVNKIEHIDEGEVTEDSYKENGTINHSHTLNKRLDPMIDPNDGQEYENKNEPEDLQNWESLDYTTNTANNSILDHMQLINLLRQQHREGKNNGHLPRVRIHNIISGLPKPEIEMLYAVYQGKC